MAFGSASGSGSEERDKPKDGKSNRETPELQPPRNVSDDNEAATKAQRPIAGHNTRACIPPYPSKRIQTESPS